MPIRLRLTLITTVLMALILAAGGWILFSQFRNAVIYTFSKGLSSRAQTIVDSVESGERSLGGEGRLIETDEAFAQILDQSGRIIDSTSGIEREPLLSNREIAEVCPKCVSYVRKDVRTVEEDTPLTPALLLSVRASGGEIVVTGASVEDEQETIADLTRDLAVVGSVALVASALVGWVVAGFALRPVEQLRREAAALSADDSKELAVPRTRDELQRLGTTLNEMIERMRDAVERERRFVDDASHELRTPLSVLRTELEVTLRRARTPVELEAALRSASEETERLQALAEDLLLLARADRGQMPIRPERTDIAATIASVAERHGAVAAERDVSIVRDVPGRLVASIDAPRLQQALDNLLSNALRHTPAGGTITISAQETNDSMHVVVEDTGTGFDDAFMTRAFDPFARSDDGRARDDGGAGLGLAIVRAIATAHGGSVEASNRAEGGARVTLRVPVSTSG